MVDVNIFIYNQTYILFMGIRSFMMFFINNFFGDNIKQYDDISLLENNTISELTPVDSNISMHKRTIQKSNSLIEINDIETGNFYNNKNHNKCNCFLCKKNLFLNNNIYHDNIDAYYIYNNKKTIYRAYDNEICKECYNYLQKNLFNI